VFHNNEWGKAKIAIERAFEKGNLVDHESAVRLLVDVNSQLGIRNERDRAYLSWPVSCVGMYAAGAG
jgi:hypothetical protein